ncbi:MAG: hypothetical protein CMJ58_22830 [Planctomycetaceae bacterium]|nr:hypothetical protein [Planctomycetaceae bacterium]
MPAQSQQPPTDSRQRKQLIVAGGLAVVLVAVVGYRMWSPKNSEAAVGDGVALATTVRPASAAAGEQPDATTAGLAALAPVDLAQILAANPFAATSVDAAPARRSPLLTDGKAPQDATRPQTQSAPPEAEIHLQAIVHDGGEPAVLVDGRQYRLNDVVQDQWRIVSVTSGGVVLEPVAGNVGQ